MTWISDEAIVRLRALEDRPDFSATRYELLEPLGRGGMGIVFRGRDRELDREVAIKVAAWSTAADADRLRAEARTLAALEHPGIVPIHDAGRLPDGRVFAVMMLVRGERLDVCARRLPFRDRLRLFDRVCDTVSFAHSRGVIHRDLKPANVMVGPFGQVFVLDWGLATSGSDPDFAGSTPKPGSDPTPSLIHGAAVVGTEGYMAPEQSTRNFNHRSDIYALGAMLRDLTSDLDMRSRLLRPLGSVIGRAMAVDPIDRYQSAGDLAADVRRFLDGLAVAAHHETPTERIARFGRTYRTPIALVLAYLTMRVLLVVWGR